MTENISFKHTFGALEKAIGISQQRHTLLTGNISNVDTPGYRPKDIDFQATLRQALQTSSGDALTRTHPDHIGIGRRVGAGFADRRGNGRVERVQRRGRGSGNGPAGGKQSDLSHGGGNAAAENRYPQRGDPGWRSLK